MGKRANRSTARTPGVTVTLVHGTYARNAAWTRPDSALHAALTGAGFRVVLFPWSGKNSHRARIHAADELITHIKGRMKDDPKAHQWIVAHSHGGNVALRAMAAVNESVPHRTQISTIALATPFTHSRGRVIQLNQAAMTALFGILLILMGWASLTTEHKTVIDWMQIVAASLFLLILTLCLVGLIMHRDKVGPGFRDRLVSSIHAPPSDVDRILVMRSAGDEASTLLAAGQFVGWLTGITSRLLGSFRLWGLIIISTQISIFVAVLLHTRRLAFMQYVFALPGLTLVVLVTLLLGSSLVFGADGPFVSLFVFTSIEASPPGGAVLLQLEPFASEGRRLAHSRLYDDERVIKQIVEVIQGSSRLARRRTTSS